MSTITLYSATETEFTKNGLGTLPDALACTVTEERNGAFELEMVYPRTGRHWADLGKHKIIFCKPDPYRDPQPFEIYKIQHTMSGKTKVSAQHISYRLSLIPVSPFEAGSCIDALNALKSHAVEPCPFIFSTDKDIASPFVIDVPHSIREVIGGIDDSILEKYKGEVEWDGWNVRLWVNRGTDRGVTIRYGKNMTDFSQEESIEDTYTGIYPYWNGKVGENNDIPLTVELPEKVLYSENAQLYPRHMTVPLNLSDKFDEPPTEEALRQEALDWMDRNEIGVPEVSMDVSFVALRQTKEYENVAPLERVTVCDTVRVQFEALNVTATAKVVKTVYDVLKDRYDSVEIGDPKTSLGKTIYGQETTLKQTAATITSNYEEKIANATATLKGAYGGHVVFGTNANGQPNEIYIMDTEDVSTAQKILRLNYEGIGFSQNGIGGPYSSAWLLNGTMDMAEINVINLIGEKIIGGIISDLAGRNSWNLTTGEFNIRATSGQISDSNIETENTTSGVRDDVATVLQHFHIREDAGLEITTSDGTAIILSNGEVMISTANIGDELLCDDGEPLLCDDDEPLLASVRQVSTDIDGDRLATGNVEIRDMMQLGNHKWLARSNKTNTTLVYVGD